MQPMYFEVLCRVSDTMFSSAVVRAINLKTAMQICQGQFDGGFVVGARIAGPPSTAAPVRMPCTPFEISDQFDVLFVGHNGKGAFSVGVERVVAADAYQAIAHILPMVATGVRMVGGPIREFTLEGKPL